MKSIYSFLAGIAVGAALAATVLGIARAPSSSSEPSTKRQPIRPASMALAVVQASWQQRKHWSASHGDQVANLN